MNEKELAGPEPLFEMKREFQIQFLKDNGLKPDHRFLDIGFSNLRGGTPIIQYLNPSMYYGVDVRTECLRAAYKELHEADMLLKFPQFKIGRFSDICIKKKFDYVWAFSTLIHMTDSILSECFKFIESKLNNGGIFYANVNIGDKPDCSWQDFPVVYRTLDFYITQARLHNMICFSVGRLMHLGHISGNQEGDRQFMLKFNKLT